jgi:RNA polymerase sigma-70 factor (ECF subfamily)
LDAAAIAVDRAAELARVFSDAAAFRGWYDVAVVRVYGYLLGRCGGDATLAEELTQQTFLEAVRHWKSFDGRSDPVTWLCAIGRNKLTDHHRRVDREERRHLRLAVREIPVAREGHADTRIEDREAVLIALRNMPALQRAAIVLRFVDGLSLREVAAALQRSEDATESLIRRAKERFRDVYGETHDE